MARGSAIEGAAAGYDDNKTIIDMYRNCSFKLIFKGRDEKELEFLKGDHESKRFAADYRALPASVKLSELRDHIA